MLTEKEIRVIELRKQGLTQIDVAKKLGITQAAVSNFEQNAHRKISAARNTLKIARQLGVRDDN